MNPNESSNSTPVHSDVHQAHGSPNLTMTPKRRGKGGIWIAVLVIAALGYAGAKPKLQQSKDLASQVKELKGELPVVSVVSLTRTATASEIMLPSNLQAIEETTLNARTNGYVKARYVDIGSKVKAGDILADIESPEMDQQLLQSQSEVSHASAGVDQARADVSRLDAAISSANSQIVMYRANVGQSQADLAHLKAKALEARSAVDVAQAKYQQAERRLDGTKAELQRAKVGHTIARKTLARWKELEKADAVSGQDVDEKQSDFDASIAKVDAAMAEVSSAEADVMATRESVKSQQAEFAATQADVLSGEQKIQAAKAALESSKANLSAAYSAKNASVANVSAAKATVGSNQANYRKFSALQAFEHVVAPFSGVITARNVDVGDLVNNSGSGSGASDPGNTVTKKGLFGLARTDTLLAQANVPEDSVTSIREGQDAQVVTREFPGRVFLGKVFHVSGALDASSRTLLVEVKIPNESGSLKPGMFAQIKFLGTSGAGAIRIPAVALIFDSKGTRVGVVKPDGTLHYATVKVGRDFGGEVEILEGLTGKEILATNLDESLQEGDKVKPVASDKK